MQGAVRRSLGIGLSVGVLLGCAAPEAVTEASDEEAAAVSEGLARFAPTELVADLDGVPEAERRDVLPSLLRAARWMDEIFLRQVAQGNAELYAELEGPHEGAVKTYFRVNFGPWDRLDEMEPWLEGAPPHPEGAGYYPPDLTADVFRSWVDRHPEDRERFESLYTVIRRAPDAAGNGAADDTGADRGLVAIPYSEEYRQWLEPAARELRSAAAATANPSLRRFLELRADAFGSDDYYESDLAWMDLDAPVEITIGPYEVYEDGLLGLKAAFEAFVTVVLPEESARLERFKSLLPSLERRLPIPDRHKNLDRGSESPIRVVDVVFVGGDSKAGVQTLAFNLPNDERVREAKGSKKVLLRNVMRAKYDQILEPIAERVLVAEDASRVSFDAYFAEVLHHELAHGLGPGRITKDGRQTEVRLELRDLYSTLEEAKADVLGVYDILQLHQDGEIEDAVREALEPTYVAGLFRSARFGLHEAHGRGVVAQFTYLLEGGGLIVDEEGRFATDAERFPTVLEELLTEMLMLQATGDYVGTAEFLDRYGRATPELEAAVERLEDVPVDIRPVYPQFEELLGDEAPPVTFAPRS